MYCLFPSNQLYRSVSCLFPSVRIRWSVSCQFPSIRLNWSTSTGPCPASFRHPLVRALPVSIKSPLPVRVVSASVDAHPLVRALVLTRKNSHKFFLCSGRDSNPRPFNPNLTLYQLSYPSPRLLACAVAGAISLQEITTENKNPLLVWCDLPDNVYDLCG